MNEKLLGSLTSTVCFELTDNQESENQSSETVAQLSYVPEKTAKKSHLIKSEEICFLLTVTVLHMCM